MRGFLLGLVLLAALAAAGCADGSGGGTERPAASPTVEAGAPAGGDGVVEYVALGDSIATGFPASEGYVDRYAAHLEADLGVRVRVTNLARNGWTSDDLLEALRDDPELREAVGRADVLTWDIGGNDGLGARRTYLRGECGGADNQDCLRAGLEEFRSNWDAVMDEILALRSGDGAVIRTMDLYNPFVTAETATDSWEDDGGLSDFEVLSGYLRQMNRYMAETAAARGIPVARVSLAFNGPDGTEAPEDDGYLAADGIHPSEAGHEVIAGLLRELGYAPVSTAAR